MMSSKKIQEVSKPSLVPVVEEYNAYIHRTAPRYKLWNLQMPDIMKLQIDEACQECGLNPSQFVRLAVFKLLRDV